MSILPKNKIFKTRIIFSLLVAISLFAGFNAYGNDGDVLPDFPDKEALDQWANECFGGGIISEIPFLGPDGNVLTNITVAKRSYTSGVNSSDCSLFTKTKSGGYEQIGYYPFIHMEWIQENSVPGKITFFSNETQVPLFELTFDNGKFVIDIKNTPSSYNYIRRKKLALRLLKQ